MKQFLVTVKFHKNPGHDPHNKKTSECPANPGKMCSDSTGEHHTLLCEGESLPDVWESWHNRGLHVTRIEEV